MIYLTELLQLPVLDRSGRRLGRLCELALVPAEDPRRVAQFVLRAGRRRLAVPYQGVQEVGPRGLRLAVGVEDLSEYSPRDDQLLVTKDLLDQQIIDTDGRKVVRVNDLCFQEQPTDGFCEVRLAEVDVGLSGAFRRLFQGLLPLRLIRHLERPLAHRVIPWEFVDLIETNPMRRVKLKISHDKLARLHPADLADIVEELAPAEREAIFETLDETKAAEALSEVEPKVQKSIIEALDSHKAADILEEMPPDEAADLLAELPAETSEGILEDMPPAEAKEIEGLLEYPKDTAGGRMTTDFIAVLEKATVDAAITALRSKREVAPSTNTLFLLDDGGRLRGALPIGRLFLAPPSTPLVEIKSEPLLFAHVDSPESDVIELFDKYNVLTLPVVDDLFQLLGVITADDIITLLKSKL